MKALLAILTMSAALLTGCGIPATEATATATPSGFFQGAKNLGEGKNFDGSPQQKRLEEDEPGWDCKTHGNRICKASDFERLEAWGLFETDSIPADHLREAFKVTYMGVAMEGLDFPPSEYRTIKSAIAPAKVHVFHIQQAN